AKPTPSIGPSPIKPPTAAPETGATERKSQGQWEVWKNRLRRAFAPAYWSNWVLAAFGVVGVFVGIGTLLAIQGEVDAATKAAVAAKDSAEASVLAQRAGEREEFQYLWSI